MTKVYTIDSTATLPAGYAKVDQDPSVTVVGTFSGATVTLVQDVDGTEIVLPSASAPLEITAAGVYPINIGRGARIRPVQAGGDGSTALTVEINGTYR